jgi:hypothetical protein
MNQFSLIMESDTEIKECWGDLIEYIMILFVRSAKRNPGQCIRSMFGSDVLIRESDITSISSSVSDRDSLLLLPANGFRQVC